MLFYHFFPRLGVPHCKMYEQESIYSSKMHEYGRFGMA